MPGKAPRESDASLRERGKRQLRIGWRRARIRFLDPVLGRFTSGGSDGSSNGAIATFLRSLPDSPKSLRRVKAPPVWREPDKRTPAELRTVAGIWRDPEAEAEAFEERPVHEYFLLHPENLAAVLRHSWNFILPVTPKLNRALWRRAQLRTVHAAAANGSAPAPAAAPVEGRLDSEELTARIRAEAARLGISTVGFAPYNPKYTFAEKAGSHDEGSVIVCLYEQDWAATQTAPSARAERAAFRAYAELTERAVSLAELIERLGHRALPHSFVGETVAIHYGVEAGLGQLGLNGQLLTPQAGSRARIVLITTDAELVHGEAVDYGINKICDSCQACVRRCPVGAIPNRRQVYRGVTKVKIKTDRCFPLVAHAEGCSVCMKVCPIQRYGLDAVKSHYDTSGGEILGKGSDALEGYGWPIDGRHYGPGSKPTGEARSAVLDPPGWQPIDPQRVEPDPPAEAG